MIVCYINNQPAYPAAQSDIKVTLQNPFIKDGDEKTMEVIFPMEIPQNAEDPDTGGKIILALQSFVRQYLY